MKIFLAWIERFPARPLGATLGLLVALTGCERNEVKVYQVATESSATTAPMVAAAPPMAAGETSAQPKLTWTLPAGWQEVPAAQFRLASFAVNGADGKKADVSIVPLGGMAGGELGNVTRWRGQVNLPPVTEEELSRLGEKVEVAGAAAKLFDFAGKSAAGDPSRILVASLERDDTSWFFKMTGDDDFVVKQKPVFIAFLKSLKFSATAATPGELPPDHPPISGSKPALPPDHPPIGAAATLTSPDNVANSQWALPSGWKEEPATAMMLAKFSAGPADAQTVITVSTLASNFGGLPTNINRWRGQMSLPPVDDAVALKSATPLEVQSEKASLVELDGTDTKTGQAGRLVVVAVPHGGETWFFKMTGDEKAVAREKAAFLKFVQTAKLSHAP